MYQTFGGFSNYFKKKTSFIDNCTFQLHYRITFVFLLLCSLLVTASQFFGSPIQCLVDGLPADFMNTYCWIHGTFTIPSQPTKHVVDEFVYLGVTPISDRNRNVVEKDSGHVGWTKDGEEIRHAWYQWVCFILFFQAILCYIPHYLWKSWEGGKLKMLIQGLDGPMLEGGNIHKEKRLAVVNYYLRTLNSHNTYVFKFVFCEILNIVNVLFQIILMDVFFSGRFSQYGANVMALIKTDTDPMNRIFPKLTKCTFHHHGPSGTATAKDGLCVLATNIINEKIYVFLWFWYIFISIWTIIHLLLRICSIASRYCRYLELCLRVESIKRIDIDIILEKCHYGDWFLLVQMSKHINPSMFHDLLLNLRDRISATEMGTTDHLLADSTDGTDITDDINV